MKTLSLTNNTSYDVSDEDFTRILSAIDSGAKHIVIQGDYIMVACIVAIQGSDRFDEAQHLTNGDYKCAHGKWHTRYDKCYGHDAFEKRRVPTNRLLDSDTRSEDEKYAAARAKAEEIRERLFKKK